MEEAGVVKVKCRSLAKNRASIIVPSGSLTRKHHINRLEVSRANSESNLSKDQDEKKIFQELKLQHFRLVYY